MIMNRKNMSSIARPVVHGEGAGGVEIKVPNLTGMHHVNNLRNPVWLALHFKVTGLSPRNIAIELNNLGHRLSDGSIYTGTSVKGLLK